MDREQAIRLAQAEVIARNWGVTRQLLAAQEVTIGDRGEPAFARADGASKPGAWFVYFPVRDQSYFFVVVIRPDRAGAPGVSAAYVEADVRAWLTISSALFGVWRRSAPSSILTSTRSGRPCRRTRTRRRAAA
jgi:hypothetical protein